MAEIATLGLRVSAEGFVASNQQAAASMDRVDASAGRASRSVTTLNQSYQLVSRNEGATRRMEQVAAANQRVAVTAGMAGGGIGRLAEPLRSLTAHALGLNPALVQVSGVLGSLMAGSTVVVGVLAGLALMGAGFRFLTRDARETAEAATESRKRLEELAEKAALGALGKTPGDVGASRATIARLQAERTRGLVAPGQFASIAGGASRLAQIEKDIAAEEALVKAGEAEISRIKIEGAQKWVSAMIAAQNRVASFETQRADAVREASEKIQDAIVEEMDARRKAFVEHVNQERAAQAASIERRQAELDLTQRAIDKMREDAAEERQLHIEAQNRAREKKEAARAGKSGSDTKDMIAGGAGALLGGGAIGSIISGGISAAMGQGFGELVSALAAGIRGLFGAGERLKEAAELAKKAAEEQMKAAAAMMKSYVEASMTFAQDVEYRILKLTGGRNIAGENAEEFAREARQQNEISAAMEAGRTESEIARLRELHAMEDLAETVERVNAALRNVPSGFKVALARFNATEVAAGAPASPAAARSVAPPSSLQAAAPAGGDIHIHGNIVLPGVRSVADLLRELEKAVVGGSARGGSMVLRPSYLRGS